MSQELLLDEVVSGFVWHLFRLKWEKYASSLHWLLVALDLAFIAPLALMAFYLKEDPQVREQSPAPPPAPAPNPSEESINAIVLALPGA